MQVYPLPVKLMTGMHLAAYTFGRKLIKQTKISFTMFIVKVFRNRKAFDRFNKRVGEVAVKFSFDAVPFSN